MSQPSPYRTYLDPNECIWADGNGGIHALPALVKSALDENHVAWGATAQHAYIIADAMLEERTKLPEDGKK